MKKYLLSVVLDTRAGVKMITSYATVYAIQACQHCLYSVSLHICTVVKLLKILNCGKLLGGPSCWDCFELASVRSKLYYTATAQHPIE